MEQYLFGKVATPSDVGKLNRLVIPKAYAEKYFPQLDIDIIHSPNTTIKKKLLGTHLNFIDGIGKTWRFRYSYWSSSQSYVITKGWSRFVKENKLHAGDIISFWRSKYCATSTGLFFYIRIDCRKSHCQNQGIFLNNNNYKSECKTSSSSALISQHQNLLPLIIDSMHEHIEHERLNIVSESATAPTVPKHLIRLFGVDVETFHSTSPLPDAAHHIHN